MISATSSPTSPRISDEKPGHTIVESPFSSGMDRCAARGDTRSLGRRMVVLLRHDRQWADRGISVVRRNQSSPESGASRFLLLEPDELCVAEIPDTALDSCASVNLCLVNPAEPHYRERVVADQQDHLLAIERIYNPAEESDRTSILFTRNSDVMEAWSNASTRRVGQRRLLAHLPLEGAPTIECPGGLFYGGGEMERFARDHAATQIEQEHPSSLVISIPSARRGKRLFDIGFSLLGLAVTLPFYPFIFMALWLEDGWPLFFSHRRQTLGGREFGCIKFRTMCRQAEQKRADLEDENHADGPQFHMVDDPRLLRVGRWLRRFHIDEWPQFWNVLTGDMSIVGPRPSPDNENQFCPTWREARLSVRPGITGLWQVERTRKPGLDFQEWIRYDLEYIERQSARLDARIIFQTLKKILWR